jgi:ribosomal-protein-serine acetyltransferase
MTVPPSHRTERLLFRPWRADDAEQLLPVLEANRARLGAWLPPRVAAPVPLPELRERLAGFGAGYVGTREWRIALFTPDGTRLLGEVCLFPRNATGRVELAVADHVEIGYWIREEDSGRGLVTEAVRGAMAIAATVPRFDHMVIRCDARNERSAAVPRRLGFEHTATVAEGGGADGAPPVMMQEWRSPLTREA